MLSASLAAAKDRGDAIASPDLRLSHRALAGGYLGGYRLAEIGLGGDVEELRAGALRTADAMFATALAPWNPTGF